MRRMIRATRCCNIARSEAQSSHIYNSSVDLFVGRSIRMGIHAYPFIKQACRQSIDQQTGPGVYPNPLLSVLTGRPVFPQLLRFLHGLEAQSTVAWVVD